MQVGDGGGGEEPGVGVGGEGAHWLLALFI